MVWKKKEMEIFKKGGEKIKNGGFMMKKRKQGKRLIESEQFKNFKGNK
jgi:hypothetical protein